MDLLTNCICIFIVRFFSHSFHFLMSKASAIISHQSTPSPLNLYPSHLIYLLEVLPCITCRCPELETPLT